MIVSHPFKPNMEISPHLLLFLFGIHLLRHRELVGNAPFHRRSVVHVRDLRCSSTERSSSLANHHFLQSSTIEKRKKMSGYVGVHVSDPWLQSQFTQVELRGLKTKFLSCKKESGHVDITSLPPLMAKLKGLTNVLTEEEIAEILAESYPDTSQEIDFKAFLRAYLNLQARAAAKLGDSKHSSSFLKATTTTLLHTINDSEKASYVAHINSYLGEDPFLNKLINVAVPGQ